MSVNYRLALANSICQWLNSNRDICSLPVLLQLLTFELLEGSSGWKVRQSVLQGIWWNKSLDN